MAETSKGRLIGFWILTGLVVLSQGASGVMDLLGTEALLEQFAALGYPAYLPMILGPAKISGVIVLAMPRLPRLKEWAYAGFVIDFIGAAASHVFNGDGPDKIMPPVIFLLVVLGSYALRPDSRKLAA